MGIDVARLIAQLAEAGLDLVHAFDAHAVGEIARIEAIREEEEARMTAEPTITKDRDATRMVLPRTSRPLARWTRLATGPRLGLLVGNTRALWAPFVAAREWLPDANPLDTYVEQHVARALEASRVVNKGGWRLSHIDASSHEHGGSHVERDAISHDRAAADDAGARVHEASHIEHDASSHDHGASRVEHDARSRAHQSAPREALVVFSHLRYDDAFLPFQQLAVTMGFAALSDAGLAIHPIYGPWFALRAVIAIDLASDFSALPSSLLDVASENPQLPSSRSPSRSTSTLGTSPVPIAKPCVCTSACDNALTAARADLHDWRAWLAVRDACSLREHRYSDEQIRFHYASAWPEAAREQ